MFAAVRLSASRSTCAGPSWCSSGTDAIVPASRGGTAGADADSPGSAFCSPPEHPATTSTPASKGAAQAAARRTALIFRDIGVPRLDHSHFGE
ncbi:hypothetical protein GCM10009736_35050 [Actinomadura bangladeshensis]